MNNLRPAKVISRLAVVTKDFSTYYIPTISKINGKQVYEIVESENGYDIYSEDGAIISSVSKSAPVVVDYTELYEGRFIPDELDENDDFWRLMVEFGNHLMEKYDVKRYNSSGEELGIYEIDDADIQSFCALEPVYEE